MKARLFAWSTLLLALAGLLFLTLAGAPRAVAQVEPASSTRSPSSASYNVEAVGQAGGSSLAVAVQDDYAYLGIGPRLVILNVSDPVTPLFVGQSSILDDFVRDVAVAGSYAYVAGGASGLHIFDVSNPAAPALVGKADSSRNAFGVAVEGDYAYVADGEHGLRLFDVRTPASPTEVGRYDAPEASRSVAVSGQFVYLAGHQPYESGTLRIIDVSSPSNPVQVATHFGGWDVALNGDYAFVAASLAPVQILDISSPAEPRLVSTFSASQSEAAVAVASVGNYLYVGYSTGTRGSIAVADISTPSDPVQKDLYLTPGSPSALTVLGSDAYVAQEFGESLLILDVSAPDALSEAGSYQTPSYAWDVSIAGHYAYLVDTSIGLRVLNVANPAAAAPTGAIAVTPGRAASLRGLDVEGDFAYLTHYFDGMHIIDVSTPTTPTQVGEFSQGFAREVDVVGDYAYTASDGYGIINVSDPTSPTLTYSPGLGGYDIVVRDNLAYIAGGDALEIIDVTQPSRPVQVGTYETAGSAQAVAVAGNYAYVADASSNDSEGQSGLRILDVSIPSTPVLVGSYDIPHSIVIAVAVSGDYAYLTQWPQGQNDLSSNLTGGLRILDIRDPARPREVGFYNTVGQPRNVMAVGDLAYVADAHGGLVIVRLNASSVPLTENLYLPLIATQR